MARHCVRWASGKKHHAAKRHHRGGKKHCRFGVVKKGRRKGACLKHKRSKKRRLFSNARQGRYIFH